VVSSFSFLPAKVHGFVGEVTPVTVEVKLKMNVDEWINQKVRISLKSGMYFKGLVLSTGEDFLKIRDFREKIVFISLDQITIIEGWGG